jgi:hypothetical protein
MVLSLNYILQPIAQIVRSNIHSGATPSVDHEQIGGTRTTKELHDSNIPKRGRKVECSPSIGVSAIDVCTPSDELFRKTFIAGHGSEVEERLAGCIGGGDTGEGDDTTRGFVKRSPEQIDD